MATGGGCVMKRIKLVVAVVAATAMSVVMAVPPMADDGELEIDPD